MIKEFLMKKMLESQLKNVPPEQKELILKAVEKNPELFEKIAKETEAKVKEGKNQVYAALEVMKKYEKELKETVGALQK